MPFKIVFDNILEISKVKNIPNNITNITAIVETNEALNPCIVPAIKIVAIDIRKGNLPITRNKVIGQNSN